MDELTLGDKTYISSKRAAELTGYAKDYVGQLCREGHVEAKMVGRSWYVLEPSIRAHRFGKEGATVTEQAIEEVIEERAPILSTWDAPRYVAEEPRTIPQVIEPPKMVPKSAPEESTEIISDMQAAWKEWFERKQEDLLPALEVESLLETPEIIDARAGTEVAQSSEEGNGEKSVSGESFADDDAVEIPLTRVQEPVSAVQAEEEEVRVPIRTVRPMSAPTPVREAAQRPSVRAQRAGNVGSSAISVALLSVLALAAVAMGVIGSGYTDRFQANNPILRYLGGTSTIHNVAK